MFSSHGHRIIILLYIHNIMICSDDIQKFIYVSYFLLPLLLFLLFHHSPLQYPPPPPHFPPLLPAPYLLPHPHHQKMSTLHPI